jgi:predicted cupin superfamily sugar epimerase
MTHATVEALIQHFNLRPLPVEGGLYVQTFRSDETYTGDCLPARYAGLDHAFGSAILMLLTDDPNSFSALHRLTTDEIYHFYLGDPIELTLLYPDGVFQTVVLGQNVLAGEQVQFVIPAGVWQGSRLKAGGSFALFGTTMAPAFQVEDFEAANRENLSTTYPQARERINALTRENSSQRMPSNEL